MTAPSPAEPLEVVSRRHPLLAALEAGPRPKGDLLDAVDCSSSTLDRAIRELETCHFLERRDGSVRLTTAGRLALEEYRRSQRALESITAASHVLQFAPPDAPLSMAVLEEATIHEPSSHAPNAPVERIADCMRDADRAWALGATERTPQFRRILNEQTTDGDLAVEVVLTDDLLSFLLEAHTNALERFLEVDAFEAATIEEIPYGLAVLETPTKPYTFVTLTNEGDVQGVIENDSQAAYEWGRELFQQVRSAATALQPPE
ncbi:helix-turn-helix transcriptional regulator [Natronosalvus rutilus]|uniref:Transcriptional regulator n=1 Tax=Natronosalvus rutilus TaxID=2953753 RepID=A0A9E7NCU0_9EURY|nr:transcriptional regulator [Natronosalvus rutilus]UTF54638.1 transcriptional regulator [Natronosalvus rutilus]